MQEQILLKQRPTTLAKARKQVEALKNQNSQKSRKKRSWLVGLEPQTIGLPNLKKTDLLPRSRAKSISAYRWKICLQTEWLCFLPILAWLFLQLSYSQLFFPTNCLSTNWILPGTWYFICSGKTTIYWNYGTNTFTYGLNNFWMKMDFNWKKIMIISM